MNEPFAIGGYWWLPETPDRKVAGTLTYRPGEGLELELMGLLAGTYNPPFVVPEFIEPPLIHGISGEGQAITLYNCIQTATGGHIGGAGALGQSKFIAHFAFVGVHFPSIGQIQFETVSVRFQYLDEWYDRNHIDTEMADSGETTIIFARPGSLNVNVSNFIVQVAPLVNQKWDSHGVSLVQKVWLNIIGPEGASIDDYLALVMMLHNFFTFSVGKPSFVTEMTARVPEGLHVEAAFPVKIYYVPIGWQPNPEETDASRMLLPYSEVENELANVMKAWVEKSQLIKPAFDLYFASIYRPAYVENTFLNLAQAIETYHRLTYGGEYMPEDAYLRGVYKTLVNALPDDLADDFRDALASGKLRYAYEFSLRKRVSLLSQHISESLKVSFLADKRAQSEFAYKVADTRNYLTHYSSDLKERAVTGGKGLHELNAKLAFLITCCFLEQLGFQPDRIEDILRRDGRYSRYFSAGQKSA